SSGAGRTADRNRSHWSTSKTPSYTKSVSWQHHQVLKRCILPAPDGGVEKLSKPNLHGVIKKVDLNTNEAEIKIKEGGQ
ncbi:hypothetical protein ACRW2X_24355, partial [Escherichia coli]